MKLHETSFNLKMLNKNHFYLFRCEVLVVSYILKIISPVISKYDYIYEVDKYHNFGNTDTSYTL
jgi:hypothetical protein